MIIVNGDNPSDIHSIVHYLETDRKAMERAKSLSILLQVLIKEFGPLQSFVKEHLR